MTLSRYNITDGDLLEYIKQLERRISKLERTPQTAYAGVNTSGIVIKGGGLFVQRDDIGTENQGLIAAGSVYTVGNFDGFETGMALRVDRSQSVQGVYDDAGTPSGKIEGATAMQFITVDGSGIPSVDTFPTFAIKDKSGDSLVSDTWKARQGFDHPRLQYQIMPATFFTSTSASFADIGIVNWYMYHPHFRITVLVQNDASTISEVNVNESGGTNLATVQSPGSTNAYVDLICRRSQTIAAGTPNGNQALLTLQIRRVSGAGTVHVRPVDATGIDLSFGSEPF
jgi:hypothetical protein